MSNRTYHFSTFQLRCGEGRLLSRDQPIELRPKSWALLCYLVEHRNRAVSKQELLDNVWSDLVVHEQAVFQSISEIRAALRPLECIETLRGRGYRWIPELRNDPVRRRLEPRWTWLAAAACVLTVLLLGGSRWQAAADSRPSLLLQAVLGSETILPPARFERAMPSVRLIAGPANEQATYRVEYRLDAGISARIKYRLIQRGESLSGTVEAESIDAVIHDLVAEIQPLLLESLDSGDRRYIQGAYRAALGHLDRNEHTQAQRLLQSLIEQHPEYAPARLRLAESFIASGNAPSASRQAAWVIASTALNAQGRVRLEATLLLAELHRRAGNWTASTTQALSAQRLALASGDDYAFALAQERLAETTLTRGDVRAARSLFLLARSLYAPFCRTGEERIRQRLISVDAQLRG